MEEDRGSPEAQRVGSSGSCHTAEEKLEKKKIYGGDRDLQETQRQSSIGSCYIAKEELRD
ncbi:hypothetical protein F2Q70_00018502 [Brassica cretica]|uniref:Uncharacterized protein n=1 Tax=Brassica cretica TaxID=69181 RepID=A0A8S9HZS4_BRACR|nr:hypothetical protein F2Q70_00018502 [Brassica cretica]KAF2595983.1 hypothetical protein F2Q68_00011934 [Brassica cretica]